ncbi:MAG: hypothetical protein H6Q13_3433 [Bacteroidetes bacterium]|nr:hypothetical protein [Bacteroidota bacterium]
MSNTGQEWFEMAKDIARAEKELGIEQWVIITIEKKNYSTNERTKLYMYDLPRHLWLKYDWVVSWRVAKFKCMYPRENVNTYLSFYDKKRGIDYGIGSLLSKLVSAKAQVTKVERRIKEYITWQEQNNMFFDGETDATLIKATLKLKNKIANVLAMENTIKENINTIKI